MSDLSNEEHDFESGKQERLHPFDRLMFGRQTIPPQSRNGQNETNKKYEEGGSINFQDMMMNIDSLMTSFNQLKPMIKKISPLLDKWKKSE
ncbi:hypothetical protein J2S13_002091 [Oikeobacillus pervagus]|uniref:Uncharacterized protein n=1 Tax=Oikeobacillus pervagus TaxID=1325931 RepID=A0AAJ1WJN6_9BACI|nr:hypothetical protein [Oikeobacillus pervagus]MDQ0215673.1 hypothetical protein [Oikeobacillus pervagus]